MYVIYTTITEQRLVHCTDLSEARCLVYARISDLRHVHINSEKRLLALSDLSVCPSICTNVSTGQIFVKFYITGFYENLSPNSIFV